MVNFGNQVIAQKLAKRDISEDDPQVSVSAPDACATHCYNFNCNNLYNENKNSINIW